MHTIREANMRDVEYVGTGCSGALDLLSGTCAKGRKYSVSQEHWRRGPMRKKTRPLHPLTPPRPHTHAPPASAPFLYLRSFAPLF